MNQRRNGGEKRDPPVQKFRASGVEVSIWEREGNLSATVRKSFKDANGQWQESKVLFPSDLTVLASLLLQAHQFCVTQNKQ